MAVIVTNMDMPPTCNHCKLCIKGKVTDYGQFGECSLINKRVNLMTWNIDEECPLLSVNEIKDRLLERTFSVVNPSDTYEYLNVISLEDIESILDMPKGENKDGDK